ncbi:hypothetical protein D623_10007135 [Myotis brandtii]|uniref:Uncharacterized protein n=1 Tax=Myotis brandtii TaxID=109478 RepID=S7Q5Q0_MYOBR|nr:hypothetical protein D623_10007135 [Myotis brandtii]
MQGCQSQWTVIKASARQKVWCKVGSGLRDMAWSTGAILKDLACNLDYNRRAVRGFEQGRTGSACGTEKGKNGALEAKEDGAREDKT